MLSCCMITLSGFEEAQGGDAEVRLTDKSWQTRSSEMVYNDICDLS